MVLAPITRSPGPVRLGRRRKTLSSTAHPCRATAKRPTTRAATLLGGTRIACAPSTSAWSARHTARSLLQPTAHCYLLLRCCRERFVAVLSGCRLRARTGRPDSVVRWWCARQSVANNALLTPQVPRVPLPPPLVQQRNCRGDGASLVSGCLVPSQFTHLRRGEY